MIAPWILNAPFDALDAIRAGTSAGLQLRSQDQHAAAQAVAQQLAQQRAQASDQDAAARLRYNYDALAATQEERKRKEALLRDPESPANRLRASHDDLLKRHYDRLDANDAEKLKQGKVHFGPDGLVLRENPDGTVVTLQPPTPKKQREIWDTITEEYPAVPGRPAQEHWYGNKPEIKEIPKRTLRKHVPRSGVSTEGPKRFKRNAEGKLVIDDSPAPEHGTDMENDDTE